MFDRLQQELLRGLRRHPRLRERVELLQSIRGVGEVTALTWAPLETVEPERFGSLGQAVSYCGLCSRTALESAGKTQRGAAVEAAQQAFAAGADRGGEALAPRWNPQLHVRP